MASWESLPSEIQARVARTVSPRDMRSVGRVSRSGRRAANRVHAERVASRQRFRADPRMAAVMTGRSLKTRVLAAILTAAEVGWTASLSRLRRAGFAVGPWEDDGPLPKPKGVAGGYRAIKRFKMPGDVEVETIITRVAAHGHDYERDRVVVVVWFFLDFIEFWIGPEFFIRPKRVVLYSYSSYFAETLPLSVVALLASVKAGLARHGIILATARSG